MIGEGVWHGEPSTMLTIVGVSMFAAAKALKWWAIGSLGRNWTFRVIVVPGMSLVHSGPYRFMRHPNYLAVVGELVGTWCMTAATFAGPAATLAFSALMLKRINVEGRALDAILRRG
jgi:methyltransferase